MLPAFLLSRILLHFDAEKDDLISDLSAAAFTPDGSLWVASDELNSLERLSPLAPQRFGREQSFPVADFVELFNQEDEIDIEGLDYANSYLWLVGSHSSKRKKTKGKKLGKDLQRLATIVTEPNRFLLARIPVIDGQLLKSASPDRNDFPRHLSAACLQKIGDRNLLFEVLKEDEHLKPFLRGGIPSKDNGFDIEGLAVKGNRIFLGLRGPVLQGWAIVLTLEIEETAEAELGLAAIGPEGRLYQKHFVDLNGLGVRELCWHDKDLLILAGPTMVLDGAMRIFRLHNALELDGDTISEQEEGVLDPLFELPYMPGGDYAEGLALQSHVFGDRPALLVVYDAPLDRRKPTSRSVFADLFQLPD